MDGALADAHGYIGNLSSSRNRNKMAALSSFVTHVYDPPMVMMSNGIHSPVPTTTTIDADKDKDPHNRIDKISSTTTTSRHKDQGERSGKPRRKKKKIDF